MSFRVVTFSVQDDNLSDELEHATSGRVETRPMTRETSGKQGLSVSSTRCQYHGFCVMIYSLNIQCPVPAS